MINIKKFKELWEIYEKEGLGALIKHLVLGTTVFAIHTAVDMGESAYDLGKKPFLFGKHITNEVSSFFVSDEAEQINLGTNSLLAHAYRVERSKAYNLKEIESESDEDITPPHSPKIS